MMPSISPSSSPPIPPIPPPSSPSMPSFGPSSWLAQGQSGGWFQGLAQGPITTKGGGEGGGIGGKDEGILKVKVRHLKGRMKVRKVMKMKAF